MKCDKCGNNEAVYFYSSDINGEKTQGCLCADCAREAGLADMGSFGDMFGGIFSDFLAPERFLPRSFGSFGAPVRSILAPSAVRVVYGGECAPREEAEGRVPADAGADIRRRRETLALRERLNAAVQAEDYEKAAELRDKLRAAERND